MEKKLTTWQAACIITGYGIGSGIMTLPYLVTRAGLVSGIAILLIAFFFSYCMHMMLAELTMGVKKGTQIVGVFQHYLFRGKFGKALTIGMFVLVTLVLIFNLAAYVAGGAEILESAGLPPILAKVLFYAIAAAVVFFGLKVLGVSEAISIDIIIAIIAVLGIASAFHLDNPIYYAMGSGSELLAFFGMAMMSFIAFFSVPQAVEGLDRDPVKVRRAIFIGLGLNLVFILVIVFCSLASSAEITQIAIIGWSEGIGLWAQILGSVFTILAMLTTYWSISLALSDIIKEQTKWNGRVCWLIATLPSLILVLLNLGSFLDLMRTAGGLIALGIAFMVPAAYHRCRKENGQVLLPKVLGSTPMQIVVLVAFLLMAVGSMVSI